MISPRLYRLSIAALALAAPSAAAQAPSEPSPAARAAAPAPPLAQIRDDNQLAEILSSITQDPAVAVDDPATRPLAQALMTEGVKQLQARAYDQALANFLEAYARFPSPKILLNVASTLRDMGRLADAANTYQRYLTDPATGWERVAEVKDLLIRLDDQLTVLTVRVWPRGSEISIDGGPFITVGSTLVTRVRTGLHLVRIRKDDQSHELTVHGFEGENKEVTPRLAWLAAEPQPTTVAEVKPREGQPAGEAAGERVPPEQVDGWLITGTQYGASDAHSRERTVRGGSDGRVVAAIVPRYGVSARGRAIIRDSDEAIESGLLGVLRIDGKGRGFAGGLGLALSRGRLELEIMALMSDEIGGYVGARYRLLRGRVRPYVAVGVPGFIFDFEDSDIDGMPTTTTRLSVGLRAAAGVELKLTRRLSVQADLGYEHFWFVDHRHEDDVFVPTVGAIGRL